jgi:hypothetical protein
MRLRTHKMKKGGGQAQEGRNKVTKRTKPAVEKNCQTQTPQNNREEKRQEMTGKEQHGTVEEKETKISNNGLCNTPAGPPDHCVRGSQSSA